MIVKIAVMGVGVCIVSIILKKYCSEYVLPLEIIFLAASVALLLEASEEVFFKMKELIDDLPEYDRIVRSLIKGVGICLLTEFSSDICSENGNKLIADVIDFSGRIMLTVIALPFIESLIAMALAFLK